MKSKKIKRPSSFIKKFKKLYNDYSWNAGAYDLNRFMHGVLYKPCGERILSWTTDHQERSPRPRRTQFVFPSRNIPYEERNIFFTDSNLLISRNEEILRIHYFTMKGYFETFCDDPFDKAYYTNLQEKKNDKYYAYLKFFYSKNQINRRWSQIKDEDIPF